MHSVFGKVKYSFGRVFSKRDLKWLKPKVKMGGVLSDDIYFDNKHESMNG